MEFHYKGFKILFQKWRFLNSLISTSLHKALGVYRYITYVISLKKYAPFPRELFLKKTPLLALIDELVGKETIYPRLPSVYSKNRKISSKFEKMSSQIDSSMTDVYFV